MSPRHIIACILFFFFLEFGPAEAVATSTMPGEASRCLTATGSSRVPEQICP